MLGPSCFHRTLLVPLGMAILMACPVEADQAAVSLEFGNPEPLPDTLYSFNSNLLMPTALHGLSYGSREFAEAVQELRPRGLRFPGGTTANNYLWRADSFSLQEGDRTEWAAQQLELFRKIGRPYDLPGYARLCRDLGLAPIYVLNIYEETPESVVALFDHLDEIGLGVEAVEFGNEPYWDPRSLMNVHDYLKFCRPLAAALREHRPDLKIGACFGPLRKDSAYPEKWNAPLAKETWFDAIVYHEYYGGQGFALEKGSELPLGAVLHPELLIDEPVEAFDELLPGKPIWFTEWNIGAKGLEQWKETGAELLFIGAAFTRLLDHRGTVDWSCFHQIYESKFGTFEYGKGKGIRTQPSYELFRLIGAAWSEAASLRTLQWADTDEVSAPALLGFATEGADGLRLVLLNRGDSPQIVTLPLVETELVGLTLATADPAAKLPVSTSLTAPLSVENGRVVLPPYSTSLLAAERIVRSARRVDLTKSDNLFPTRPHLQLWYPPYAAKQPRVAPDGSYTLDLDALRGKKSAVVTLNLTGLPAQTGESYELRFEASSSAGAGLVARLPSAAKKEGIWMNLTPERSEWHFEFQYDPSVHDGAVSFFLPETSLAKGGRVQLRDFEIVRQGE